VNLGLLKSLSVVVGIAWYGQMSRRAVRLNVMHFYQIVSLPLVWVQQQLVFCLKLHVLVQL
jgi:hypothetical protein